MTELQEKIVAAVREAGGSIGWADLMASLEYREQQQATKIIRALEQQEVLKRVVARNAETGVVTFTVNQVGA